MPYAFAVGGTRYAFADLRTLLARAAPPRAGDRLAGLAASNAEERVAARLALADMPLAGFLQNPIVPYESDDVTRLIVDTHDAAAFAPVAGLTVGAFRDWLLSDAATPAALAALAPGVTPRNGGGRVEAHAQPGPDRRRAARLRGDAVSHDDRVAGPAVRPAPAQPSERRPRRHRRRDPRWPSLRLRRRLHRHQPGNRQRGAGAAAARTHRRVASALRHPVAVLRARACDDHAAGHAAGRPRRSGFQSIAGSQAANAAFGVTLAMLDEAHDAVRGLGRAASDANLMYFETGQGAALSADAHHGIDQQTMEARAYAVARRYRPLLVNTVVGFIGPEYLYDGKEIIRAGLEDHFCGKLLGLPMGVDVCYTNHVEADQDDMDNLLTLLGVAGCTYIMGVPGADDIMLGYQSTAFHDALYVRAVLGLRPAPEFEAWLQSAGIMDAAARIRPRLDGTAGRLLASSARA